MTGSLRVLAVDDSVIYRKILSDVVSGMEGIELVGTSPNGKLALSRIDREPVDLVLLDIEMPEMDGFATLCALKEKHPDIGAIMVSGLNRSSADITIRALQAGAIDFIPKPSGGDPDSNARELAQHLRPLFEQFQRIRERKKLGPHFFPRDLQRSAAPAPLAKPGPFPLSEPAAAPAAPVPRSAPIPTRFDVLVIGVSTGGPNALMSLIPSLPGDLGVPVLIVQHMPPVFTASLAQSLNTKSALTVSEGQEGDTLEPNHVFIAPGGKHMVVRNKGLAGVSMERVIALNESPPVHNCRPSVDVLFRSVAMAFERNILSVIMTGMGSDGADGVRTLKRKGCLSLTQSADSCVVYGMPRAVDESGLSDESIPLSDLAYRITRSIKP